VEQKYACAFPSKFGCLQKQCKKSSEKMRQIHCATSPQCTTAPKLRGLQTEKRFDNTFKKGGVTMGISRSLPSSSLGVRIWAACLFTFLVLLLIAGLFLPTLLFNWKYLAFISTCSVFSTLMWVNVWHKTRDHMYLAHVSLWCIVAALHAIGSIMHM